MLDSFRDIEYELISSLILPMNLVIDSCIAFVTRYAGYLPGSKIDKGEAFFISMPLMIYSSSPSLKNRTLIWGNGMIFYSDNEDLMLFVDADLLKKIEGI